ncbi:MAG: hypothetical protein WD231_03600 [Candidatus Woykebacteria bacterium]
MQPKVSAAPYVASLPVYVISWWFLESPKLILKILTFFFSLVSHQLGYRSLFKTFFKPWKNEYREGLVGFSIYMGMFMKSLIIFVGSLILFTLLVAEVFIFLAWVFLPFIALWWVYVGLFT